jgi:hypothetical protein
MRRAATGLAFALFGAAAWAQQDQPVVVPPPPPIVSAPIAPVAPVAPTAPEPPGLVQTPVPPDVAQTPPDNTDTGQPANQAAPAGAAPAGAVPDIAPVPDNTWLPGKTATLGVLDEVDGGTTEIDIPVGGQAAAGDLQISVQSCVTRPSGDIPDSAIFITVQSNSGAGAPIFRGWMVRSTPGATVAGDAGETLRVIGCS